MLTIRRAIPADVDELIILFAAHASYEGSIFEPGSHFRKDLVSLIFEYSIILCWVVVRDQKIMGYATCIEQYATWSAQKYLYMDCLFLNEELRGHGIGKQIMNDIAKEFKERALSEIQWQTPATNQSAIDFYLKIGGKEFSKSRFIWTP